MSDYFESIGFDSIVHGKNAISRCASTVFVCLVLTAFAEVSAGVETFSVSQIGVSLI
jgi:hypothetical protein